MNRSKLLKTLAISVICTGSFIASGAAFATPCLTVAAGNGNAQLGNASTDDVTLNGSASDSCAFSNVNPAGSGSAGDTSGFATSFDAYTTTTPSTWTTLGKIEQSSGSVSSSGLTLTLSADGTWTVKNTTAGALVLDLVLDIHAGSGSTAFLFDDQAVGGGQTLNGTWKIDGLNNGGRVPGFSNAVFFARDVGTPGPGGNVPEPGSVALMGLGMLGVFALRKRNKA
jgi:hypothetical protein